MPKSIINYTKTVMYHFICNDDKITNTYVGHTTDFTRRKAQHKYNCNHPDRISYNYKLYKTIRDNGGWSNWSIVPLEEFPCETKMQAVIRERTWVNKLKPSMNTNITFIENITEYRAVHNKKYYDKKKSNVIADDSVEPVKSERLCTAEDIITV